MDMPPPPPPHFYSNKKMYDLNQCTGYVNYCEACDDLFVLRGRGSEYESFKRMLFVLVGIIPTQIL